MWVVLGVLAATALIVLADAQSLLRNRNYKLRFIYFTVLSTGIMMNLLYLLGIKLPNPLNLWVFLMEPIGKWIMEGLFK